MDVAGLRARESDHKLRPAGRRASKGSSLVFHRGLFMGTASWSSRVKLTPRHAAGRLVPRLPAASSSFVAVWQQLSA